MTDRQPLPGVHENFAACLEAPTMPPVKEVTKEMIEAVAWSASSQPGTPFGMILTDEDIQNILLIGIANCPPPQTRMSAVTALPNLLLDGVHRDYALKGLLHENLVEQISVCITDPDAEKLEFVATPEAVGRNIADPLVGLRSRPVEVRIIGTIRICEEVVKIVQVKVEPLHELLLSEGASTAGEDLCSCTLAHQHSAAAPAPQPRESDQ
jgi:hypothetical protein|nr:hypothetical protein [Neorhizobium tomejilense]